MRDQIFSVTSSVKLLFRESPVQTNSLIILVAIFSIFIIDLHLPVEVGTGMLYALAIFYSLSVDEAYLTHLTVALGLLFTAVASYLSLYLSADTTIPLEIFIINQIFNLLLIIFTAIMVIRIRKANTDISTLMAHSLINPITGYKNKRAFEIELDTETLRCKRYNRNLSIAIIDIDQFRAYSDSYSCKYAQEVIKRICREIKSNIRTSDLFYHIDLDVFTILFPETELLEAKEVCEAIRKKVSIKMNDENTERKITLSIGIATLTSMDNKINLRKRAEDALLISKNKGKNSVSSIPHIVGREKNLIPAILSKSRSD